MPKQRSLAMATIALIAAALVFSYTLARAVTVEKQPDVAVPVSIAPEKSATADTPAPGPTKPAARKGAVARDQIVLAVENDPFQPDRQRPSERYRMPGEQVDEEPPPPEPPPPPPNFRVVGTIATPRGGVAVVETGDATRVVGIGEVLSGFTLSGVTNRSATVEGNGRSYSLQIEEPSIRRPASRSGRAGGRGAAQGNAQQAQEMQARLREQIERLRQNGAPPGVLEQLMQQLGGRGNMESVEVIRGPNGESQFILRPRADSVFKVAPAPVRRNNN